MITGDKLLALLDQADKTERDLIRYVCNGLQAYTVNQSPIDPIWLLLSGLREVLIKPRLPGSVHHYDNIPQSSSFARDYRNDLKKLSLKKPRRFEEIRDTLIPRDMDVLARFLIDKYYERQDIERHIERDINPRGFPPNFLAANAESLAKVDPRYFKISSPYGKDKLTGMPDNTRTPPVDTDEKQKDHARSNGTGWCVGRKAICEHLDVSWSTVLRHKYPLLKEDGSNRPMQSKQALDAHRQARSQKKKK